MDKSPKAPATIDAYIASFPEPVRSRLARVRALVAEEAPDASEKISYRIPTFFLNGNLVHFGAFERHIGFYPTSSGTAAFEKDLAPFKHSKGAIQFPHDKPLPEGLIRRIVRFRVRENAGGGKGKRVVPKQKNKKRR